MLLTGAAAAGVAGRLIAAASLYCTNGAPMLQYRTIGGMIGVYDLELSIRRSNENFGQGYPWVNNYILNFLIKERRNSKLI